MLLRMYAAWSKAQSQEAEIVEWYAEDPTDIREVTILLPAAWPLIQKEAGHHRLVRVSPFGAKDKLQTSWAIVETMPEPSKPKVVVLSERDIKTEVFRASGHGGQGVNTTDSAVRLTHLPTGIKASCQATRSQIKNKDRAWNILTERVRAHLQPAAQAKAVAQQVARRSYVLDGHQRIQDDAIGKTGLRPDRVLAGEMDALLPATLAI